MRRQRKQTYSRLVRFSNRPSVFANIFSQAAITVSASAIVAGVLCTSQDTPEPEVLPKDPEGYVEPATSLGMNGVEDRKTLTINSSVYNSLIHMKSNTGAGCSGSLVDLGDYGLAGDFMATAGHCVVYKDSDHVYEYQTLTLDGYDHEAGRYITYQWNVDHTQVFLHPDYIADTKDPYYTQFDIAIVRVGSDIQPMPDWALALPVDTTFEPDITDGQFCQNQRVNVFGFPHDYKVVHDNDRHDQKKAVAHYGALTDQCVSDYHNSTMTMRPNAFTSQADKGSGESGGLTAIVREGRSVMVAVNSALSSGFGYEKSDESEQKFRQSIHVGIWAFDEYWEYAADHFGHVPFVDSEDAIKAGRGNDPVADLIQSLDQG